MQNAVIVSGARTPMGRFGGAFKDVAAPDLGAAAIKAALERAGVSPDMVEEVVLGNALQAQEAGYAATARFAQRRHPGVHAHHSRQPTVLVRSGGDQHGRPAHPDR